MIGYIIYFHTGEQITLFHQDFWADKRFFYTTHTKHLEKVCELISEIGFPLELENLATQKYLNFHDATTLNAWLEQHQGLKDCGFIANFDSDEALYHSCRTLLENCLECFEGIEKLKRPKDFQNNLVSNYLSQKQATNLEALELARRHKMLLLCLKRMESQKHNCDPNLLRNIQSNLEINRDSYGHSLFDYIATLSKDSIDQPINFKLEDSKLLEVRMKQLLAATKLRFNKAIESLVKNSCVADSTIHTWQLKEKLSIAQLETYQIDAADWSKFLELARANVDIWRYEIRDSSEGFHNYSEGLLLLHPKHNTNNRHDKHNKHSDYTRLIEQFIFSVMD